MPELNYRVSLSNWQYFRENLKHRDEYLKTQSEILSFMGKDDEAAQAKVEMEKQAKKDG